MTVDLHGSALWGLGPDEATLRYRALLDRIVALPGVERAGAIDVVPLSDNYSCDGFRRLDLPPPGPGEGRCVEVRSATPGALEALGVPLIAGRGLEWTDDSRGPRSLVVSRRTADQFWPDETPLGHIVQVHSDTFTVVGVVADIHHFGPAEQPSAMAFLSAAQEPWNGIARGLTIVAAGSPAVELMAADLRVAIGEVDPRIAVERIRPMGALLSNTVGGPRFRATLLILFAGLAMVLALVGISGVMAQAVARRRRELGIRIAVGATPGQATATVLGDGARLTALGLAIGLLASIGLTRLLRTFVFGVSPLEPAVLLGGCAFVCALGLLACWLPARAAASIDPMLALRID
jgi:hypothetical protein